MRVSAMFLLALAIGAVSALATACGDDDDDAPPTPEMMEIVLYFPRVTDTGFDFVEATRSVPEDESGIEEVLGLLLAGPTADEEGSLGAINPFPGDVQLLSVEVSGDTATVDFSKALLDYGGGSANVEAISGAITRTLQAATGATNVVILVEGEPDQLQP